MKIKMDETWNISNRYRYIPKKVVGCHVKYCVNNIMRLYSVTIDKL